MVWSLARVFTPARFRSVSAMSADHSAFWVCRSADGLGQDREHNDQGAALPGLGRDQHRRQRADAPRPWRAASGWPRSSATRRGCSAARPGPPRTGRPAPTARRRSPLGSVSWAASASMMPARSPGANPVRTATASCGEVSQRHCADPHAGAELGLDLGHQHRHRPGAAVHAAAELLGLPGQPVLGHHDRARTPRCAPPPATSVAASCSLTAAPAPGRVAGWWRVSHWSRSAPSSGTERTRNMHLGDQFGAGAGVQQGGQAAAPGCRARRRRPAPGRGG